MGSVSDLEWLNGAADMEIVIAAGAVVTPTVSTAATAVAAELASRIGGYSEEGEVAAAVGGMGDELRQLSTRLVEDEVAGWACVHGTARLKFAGGTKSVDILWVVGWDWMEVVGMAEVFDR